MPEKKTAVIIGAGIGGITTAVYLARNGYTVNVFEKNSSPGGRCGQIIQSQRLKKYMVEITVLYRRP